MKRIDQVIALENMIKLLKSLNEDCTEYIELLENIREDIEDGKYLA